MTTNLHENFASQGLVRPTNWRLLGGVCAGLARRFGMDPWAVRALFALSLFLPGSQLVIYPILWVLMPSEQTHLAATPTQEPAADTPA